MRNTRTRTVIDEDGNEVDVRVPFKWAICQRCNGDGTHVNPAIDGHGITAEEWNGPDWDDESRDMYLTGGYDVSCSECDGSGKVRVDDYTRLRVQDRRLLEADDQALADLRAAEAAEARYFAMFER